MGFQYSSLKSKVTIEGAIDTVTTLPKPSATQTIKNGMVELTSSNQILLTASAGKTLYVMGLAFMNEHSAAVGYSVFKHDGSTLIMYPLIGAYALQVVSSNTPLFTILPGETIKVKATNDASSIFGWGYEE